MQEFKEVAGGVGDLFLKSVGPMGNRFILTARDFWYTYVASREPGLLSQTTVPFNLFSSIGYISTAPLQFVKRDVSMFLIAEEELLSALAQATQDSNHAQITQINQELQNNSYAIPSLFGAGLLYSVVWSVAGSGFMIGLSYALDLGEDAKFFIYVASINLFQRTVDMLLRQMQLGIGTRIIRTPCGLGIDGSVISVCTSASYAVGSGALAWYWAPQYLMRGFGYATTVGLLGKGLLDVLSLIPSKKVFKIPALALVRKDFIKIHKEHWSVIFQMVGELSVVFGLPLFAHLARRAQLGAEYSEILSAAMAVSYILACLSGPLSTGMTRQIGAVKKHNPNQAEKIQETIAIKTISRRGIISTAVMSGLCTIPFFAAPEWLASFFTSDPNALALSKTIMPLVGVGEQLYNTRYSVETTLRMGYDDTKPAMVTAVGGAAIFFTVCFAAGKSVGFDSWIFCGLMFLSLVALTARCIQQMHRGSCRFWRSPDVQVITAPTETSPLVASSTSSSINNGDVSDMSLSEREGSGSESLFAKSTF